MAPLYCSRMSRMARLGSPEYAVEKLGVECLELKWGQGAKNIGGEVKLKTLDRALELKRRGYVVLPDPEDPVVQKAFKEGAFKEFERHSRLGMVEYDNFMKSAEYLRKIGAKFVSLKTGAYRVADLAQGDKVCIRRGDRPAHDRRCRRRNRNEPVEDDE